MRFRKTLLWSLMASALISANTTPIAGAKPGMCHKAMTSDNIFRVENPDYVKSPYSGMTRKHWIEAAKYLLDGAFSYIHCMDDPMYFPKQLDKTYPHDENAAKVAKLEGLARTLFVAAPLLKENPDLEINGIKVADYYRHQMKSLTNPDSKHYVEPKPGGPTQTLLELGSLCISMGAAPEALWDPLTKEGKDNLATLLKNYGEGPTISSNWQFFNVFILSFLKDKGYQIDEAYLQEKLNNLLARYRGEGWYNDVPAYDYYSMWAFQSYGPLWAELFGKKQYPELAARFFKNQGDLIDNYPYMFAEDGRMNMYGRSIPYRFAAVAPLPLIEYGNHENVNYGWLRRIASATLLQFLQNPEFLENGVPTMGYYGPFAPCVQIYSCRGSVYWCGKAFLGLVMPEDSQYWSATENNGPWDNELAKGKAYDKFQPATGLMITNYPNSGSSELRSWCHESVANDWQKFRSSENYNKLAYNTAFPWMADGTDGEISMNYATKNGKGEWEVLRLYDFKDYKDGIYRRDAVLETDTTVRYQLADITLPDGILRIDRVTTPDTTDIRLGHYSLKKCCKGFSSSEREVEKNKVKATIVGNGNYELAMIPLYGWTDSAEVMIPKGLHPESKECILPVLAADNSGSRIYVTLQLWKKIGEDGKGFTDAELQPVKSIKVSNDGSKVTVKLTDKTTRTVEF